MAVLLGGKFIAVYEGLPVMELYGTKGTGKKAAVNQSNGYISGKYIQGTNTFYKDACTFNEIYEIYEIHLYEEL